MGGFVRLRNKLTMTHIDYGCTIIGLFPFLFIQILYCNYQTIFVHQLQKAISTPLNNDCYCLLIMGKWNAPRNQACHRYWKLKTIKSRSYIVSITQAKQGVDCRGFATVYEEKDLVARRDL